MTKTLLGVLCALLVHFALGKKDSVCSLAPEEGACDNFMIRWHYSATNNVCLPFVYSGCLGNENNFGDEESCLLKCATFNEDPCTAAMEKGNCSESLIRWHFNPRTDQCEKFIYSGCGGTSNNFINKDECEAVCGFRSINSAIEHNTGVCGEPKWRGPCSQLWLRWFYHNSTQQCAPFVYGGCEGNRNNFLTKRNCEAQCVAAANVDICKLPMSQGSCSASLIRWYFNAATNQCEKFIYGGCEGNQNNFVNREACEKKCSIASIPPDKQNPCEQLPERGPCKEALVRWYYDGSRNLCRPLVYGGCEGNENNFASVAECIKTCVVIPTGVALTETTTEQQPITKSSVCALPMEQGPCDKHLLRWYYNSRTGSCEKFIYGGCVGNGNNFISKENCQKMCFVPAAPTTAALVSQNVFNYGSVNGNQCRLPLAQGLCNMAQIRWYYNSHTMQCERFVYGGCGGNANNFASKEECEKQCILKSPEPGPAFAYRVAMPSNNALNTAHVVNVLLQRERSKSWRFNKSQGCYQDGNWCRANPATCFRSKLECLEKWSPQDVICLSVNEGFHIWNPKEQCTKHFFTCLGGRFANHTCQAPLRFDVATHLCRPPQFVPACRI